MKKYSLVYTILAFMAFGIFFANQVSAASNTLNFQSKIVNVADGTNVVTGTPACVVAGSANDTCDFRVNIYSASSAGTLYFSETHSNVEIGQYNGIFNLAINSVCASTSTAGTDGNWTAGGCVSNGGVDFSSSNLWIEIAFAPGGAGSFTETFSRVQIKDVASARYAVSSSYLGGLAASDFVQFKPGSTQTTTSTNSLINLETTGNTSAPLIYVDEDGAGTPDLLRLQTNDVTMFQVGNAGAVTMAGDLINSSTGTIGLFNTNVTTLNIGGASTTLNLAGGSASTGCTINSTGDLTCSGAISGGIASFLQGGNSFGALAVLGTNDVNALAFETSGVERMRIGTDGQIGIGTTTLTDTQFKIQTGILNPGVTMSASSSSTTFTTSGSITLYPGDFIVPSSGAQAREVTVGGTGTSFTVDSAFTSNLSGASFTVSRKSQITGPRPALSLNKDMSPYSAQEWLLRVGGDAPGSNAFELRSSTTGITALYADNDGDVMIGSNVNYGGVGNTSRMFVYGGASGANIDVMGDGSVSDQSTIELQSSDYDTSFASTYLQHYGVNGTGTTLGFSNTYLGALVFQSASVGVISTNSAAPLVFGTDNAERGRFEATGNFVSTNDISINGGDLLTNQTTFNLLNATATTINFGGAATTLNIGPGGATATSIVLAGGSGATGCTLTGATGDLACSGDLTVTGGDLITTATTAALFNTGATTAVNIAGAAATTNLGGTTVNLAGGSSSTGCTIDSSGNLTCTGTIAATVAADSLDYIDFEDTMDLDAALTLNQGTNTWTQNFTGTTTVGKTYNVNSLTTGTGLAISSTATGLTSGNLASITLSGSNAANAGDLLELSISGTLSAARGLYINNLGTGDSLRIDDAGSDTTPFVIDASGNVSVGGNINTSLTSIDVVNTTATTVNFAGAATTLALAGGSGSTGCTINSSGDITCSGDLTATGGDLITTATTAALFNTGATTAVNIAGAAATTNIGGTTVNLAGGVGSTGCTIDSAGALTCTGGIAATVAADSLDYDDFEDIMDYDAALTVNQGSFAWTQEFTGTGNGFTYNANSVTNGYATVINANSLTGGRALVIDSGAANQSGSLLYIENNAASATNTGNLAQLWVGGNISNLRPLYITNLGNGESLRIDDVSGDTTPFVIDASGNVSVGGNINTSLTSIDLLNTTAATINFGGAATTALNIGPGGATAATVDIAGGSGATGCTVAGATGNLTCSGTISGTFAMAADSLDYIDFQDTLDYDNHLTVNQGSFINVQNFTGSTNVGTAYNVNSLTTGTGFAVVSSATGLTTGGSVATIALNGNNAANTGDLLELIISGTSTAATGINMINYGTGNSLRIDDVSGDTTPFVIDASGNVSVGGNINTSLTSIDLLNTTAATINFGGAATILNMAGGSGLTGCTINSSGDITCSGDVTATGGDLITTATTATLFNSGATTLSIGGAATTFNIGPGGSTATTLLFAGGSAATGCSMTGNDGAFSCTSTIAGGAFSTGGNITGNVLSGASLSVTGAVSSNSLTTGGVTATGLVNTGNASVDYTPTTGNWGSTGSTILLNALNYSTMAFHDAGSRVDFIRVGAGTMTLGYDGGYGNAAISMPGQVTIGSGSPSSANILTLRQNITADPVMHIINTGDANGAQALHVQGCQNTPTAACNLIILYDGDGTQAGRIQIANGGGSAYQTTSDVRSKKNIAETAYSLEDLLKVQVRDYEYLDSNVRRTGYVAQELYNVFPSAVGVTDDPNEMWAVDYGAMTPLIVQGVQDLNDIVEGNTRSIADLKVRDTELLALINGLTTRVAGLETRVATLEGAQSGSGAAVDLVNFMATNGSFSGNLTVAGNTNINGKVYLGNENVGEAKILAGDTEVTIVFDTPFETMPIVQVTPQSDNFLTLPVKYVVSEKAANKFKIKIDVAQLEDLVFNWSVSGTRDGIQIDSDGNVANL